MLNSLVIQKQAALEFWHAERQGTRRAHSDSLQAFQSHERGAEFLKRKIKMTK